MPDCPKLFDPVEPASCDEPEFSPFLLVGYVGCLVNMQVACYLFFRQRRDFSDYSALGAFDVSHRLNEGETLVEGYSARIVTFNHDMVDFLSTGRDPNPQIHRVSQVGLFGVEGGVARNEQRAPRK